MSVPDHYKRETELYAGFLAGLRDLCNQHRVMVQGDSDDSFATLSSMPDNERIRSITIGSYGALTYEMESWPS